MGTREPQARFAPEGRRGGGRMPAAHDEGRPEWPGNAVRAV